MMTFQTSTDAIAILGRQPELSVAELEQVYGSVSQLSDEAALVANATIDIASLGGTTKAGLLLDTLPPLDWKRTSQTIARLVAKRYQQTAGKLTIGISVYGKDIPPRDVQHCGLMIKKSLKQRDGSVRLIPNEAGALSTATSHHNKLGLSDNKIELLVVYAQNNVYVALSTGAQNITALAARDQGRPKRDAFVGMLPPKLALMMINLSGAHSYQRAGRDVSAAATARDDAAAYATTSRHEAVADNDTSNEANFRILDPFCGTGVILQEAALLGYNVYGTDLAAKMVDYAQANLDWLQQKMNHPTDVTIHHGDAIETSWQPPINAVVSETYLGQPFSAPPSPDKLAQVRGNCNEIISKFLTNLASQIKKDTPLCLAVPAWRDGSGRITYLPLVSKLESLGYQFQPLTTHEPHKLVYYREDQVVARQLLVLKRL